MVLQLASLDDSDLMASRWQFGITRRMIAGVHSANLEPGRIPIKRSAFLNRQVYRGLPLHTKFIKASVANPPIALLFNSTSLPQIPSRSPIHLSPPSVLPIPLPCHLLCADMMLPCWPSRRSLCTEFKCQAPVKCEYDSIFEGWEEELVWKNGIN